MHRLLCGVLVLAVGCTSAPSSPFYALPTLFPEDSPEAAGLLEFVNDPEVDHTTLEVRVGLDARAAEALLAHRDGPDGTWGTADDDLYDAMRELEDTPWVSHGALYAMLEYAWLRGWMEGHLRGFDGVGFTPAEARAALFLANDLSFEALDEELGLDSRAAESIVAARPIPDMSALADVHYVGEAALRRLRDAAWVD